LNISRPYGYHVLGKDFFGHFYYQTFDKRGNILLVGEKGKVYDKIAKNCNGINFIADRNGNFYHYYRKPLKGQKLLRGGKFRYVVKKNGKPFNLVGLKGNYANIAFFGSNSLDGRLMAFINLDNSVGGLKHLAIYGDKQYKIQGNTWSSMLHFTLKGEDVFSIHC